MQLSFVVLLIAVASCRAAEIKEEDDVMVLTTANFDEAIKSGNVLVEFCKLYYM